MIDQNYSYSSIVDSLECLTNGYLFGGHIDEAVLSARRGLEVLEANQAEERELARGLLLVGTMLNKLSFIKENRFGDAIYALSRAQTLAEQLDEPSLHAKILLQVGMAYDTRKLISDEGDYETAMGYFQKAKQKFEQVNDQVGIGRAFFGIGLIHQRLQQLEGAETNFSRALEIAQQQNDKLDISEAYRHRGFFYTLDGDWETARHHAEESLRLREEIGCRYLLSPAHHVLGLVCKDMGEKDAALSHYQTALGLAETLELKLFMLQPLFALSEWYQAADDSRLALAYAQRALIIAKELNYLRAIETAQTKPEVA